MRKTIKLIVILLIFASILFVILKQLKSDSQFKGKRFQGFKFAAKLALLFALGSVVTPSISSTSLVEEVQILAPLVMEIQKKPTLDQNLIIPDQRDWNILDRISSSDDIILLKEAYKVLKNPENAQQIDDLKKQFLKGNFNFRNLEFVDGILVLESKTPMAVVFFFKLSWINSKTIEIFQS